MVPINGVCEIEAEKLPPSQWDAAVRKSSTGLG